MSKTCRQKVPKRRKTKGLGLILLTLFIPVVAAAVLAGTSLLPKAASNITVAPASTQLSVFGKAAKFPRGNNYIATPLSGSASGLNPKGPMTVETWIKFNESVPSTESTYFVYKLANYNYPGSGATTSAIYYLQWHQNKFTVSINDTSRNLRGFATSSLPQGASELEWHHVAGVYDGNNVKLFIDGKLKNIGSLSNNNPLIDDSLPLLIPGGAVWGVPATQATPMTLDELRISNIARYSFDFALPQSPSTPDPNALLLYHFNGFEQNSSLDVITKDSSQNGFNGQIVNRVEFVGSPDYEQCPPQGLAQRAIYYGSAKANSQNLPAGLTIKVYTPERRDAQGNLIRPPVVAGCGETSSTAEGTIYKFLNVWGEDAASLPEPFWGMKENDLVNFKINGQPALTNPFPVVWHDGQTLKIDLSINTPVNPSLSPTPTLVALPTASMPALTPSIKPTGAPTPTTAPKPTPTGSPFIPASISIGSASPTAINLNSYPRRARLQIYGKGFLSGSNGGAGKVYRSLYFQDYRGVTRYIKKLPFDGEISYPSWTDTYIDTGTFYPGQLAEIRGMGGKPYKYQPVKIFIEAYDYTSSGRRSLGLSNPVYITIR